MEQLAALLLVMQPAAETAPCSNVGPAHQDARVCAVSAEPDQDQARRHAITLSPDFSASLNGGVGREPVYRFAPARRVFVAPHAPRRVSAGEAVRRAAGRD